MQLYLPIAEITVNIMLILGMGLAVGFISGLFGIGGGFLLTPLLIFSGVTPAVAVASVTPQIVASSASAANSYLRRRMLDGPLAAVLILGGLVGSALGVFVFRRLRALGQLDLIISVAYVTFLGLIGGLMLRESLRSIRKVRHGGRIDARLPGQHTWLHGLPLKMRFRRSKLYISVVPVVGLGLTIGFLGTVLGIGGGFMMVPALIYLLRVPTSVVIGTSLVYILATMGMATMLHAVANGTVDIYLSFLLMVGGVMGARIGVRFGSKLRGEQLRGLLGLLVLGVGLRFLVDLVVEPDELYSLTVLDALGSAR